MNLRLSQTNLQLQLQLTGWLALSATIEAPKDPLSRVHGTADARVTGEKTKKEAGLKSVKTEKSQNELWKCLLNKDFQHFANATSSPFWGCRPYGFALDENSDPGAEFQRKPALAPPKDAKRR